MKTKSAALADFHWQGGYGIFSVSQAHADAVVEYILNQEEHHREESFQDELRRLFKQERIEYDERYLWE